MTRIRIYDLAKELNTDNDTLLDVCKELSISAKVPSSSITEEESLLVKASFVLSETTEINDEKPETTPEVKREKGFDFASFRVKDNKHYSTLVDTSQTFPVICRSILKQFVGLRTEDLEKITLAYILTPSALSNKLPILTCIGQKGSGKSTLGKFASCVYYGERWANSILGQNATFASLRTKLYKSRFPYGENANEQNSMLVWDDLSPTKLRDDAIYALLKSGYDRSTDTIALMGGKDESGEFKVIEHRVFTGKIVSTIHVLSTFPEFDELERRLLVIPFVPSDKSFRDFEQFDWTGFDLLFLDFWKENALSFVENKSKYREFIENKIEGKQLISHRQSTLLDVYISGITCGIWTPKEGTQILISHEDTVKSITEKSQSALVSMLAGILCDLQGTEYIEASMLRTLQTQWGNEGILTNKEKSVDGLKEAMVFLGYHYVPYSGWTKTLN